eukprot:scpid57408/ scgid21529/ Suppressor of SWI4 1 homolog; Peter Pan homolog
MAKGRRKKKKVLTSAKPRSGASLDEGARPPQAIVVSRGEVGHNVLRLVMDLRRIMEPFTAPKLKVRKNNVIKDYVAVAGPLGITHMLMLTKTEEHTNLRMARFPRGPTLFFQVNEYSFMKDIATVLRRPKSGAAQFQTPALLILNNFGGDAPHMKVMASMFQNMFPAINIQKLKLADIRRCVLITYDSEKQLVYIRHFHVQAVPVGMSRQVKRLLKLQLPNLSTCSDISDYLLNGGLGSESEAEDPADTQVTLPQNVPGRGNLKQQRSAVRLTELGPRVSMQLMRIEDGFCDGEVIYHSYIKKTKKEVKTMQAEKKAREELRVHRRREQEKNVKLKAKKREEHKKKCRDGLKKKMMPADAVNERSHASEDSEDDADYYRKEVGEDPDAELFPSRKRRRRETTSTKAPAAKRTSRAHRQKR